MEAGQIEQGQNAARAPEAVNPGMIVYMAGRQHWAMVKFGVCLLDPARRILWQGRQQIKLRPIAFNLLIVLLKSNGRVLSKSELVKAGWRALYVADNTLRFHMHTLKKLLGPGYFEADMGGYRFLKDVDWPDPPTITMGDFNPLREFWRSSAPGAEIFPVFSPDGRYLAFSWNTEREHNFRLYIRDLSVADDPRPITGSDANDFSATWTLDGQSLTFVRVLPDGSAAIMSVRLADHIEQMLLPMTSRSGTEVLSRQLEWSPAGDLAFVDRSSLGQPFRIFVRSSSGVHPLTSPPPQFFGDTDPTFSPDGRHLAFLRSVSSGVKEIHVLDTIARTERKLLGAAALHGLTWTSDGEELVFSSFDFGAWRLWRMPVNRTGDPQIVSVSGHAMYPHIARDRIESLCGPPYPKFTGERNPNHSSLTYMEVFLDTNIWRLALPQPGRWQAPPPQKLLFSTRHDVGPRYSPDGKLIAFSSDRSGTFEIWVAQSDGSHAVQLTNFRTIPGAGSPRWSPDGRELVFDFNDGKRASVYVGRVRDRAWTMLVADAVVPCWGTSSWIYFASNREDGWQIWRTTRAGVAPQRVTTAGGFAPVESPIDERFVYYVKHGESGLWRLCVIGEPSHWREEQVSEDSPAPGFWGYWDLTRDGIYSFAFPSYMSPPNVLTDVRLTMRHWDADKPTHVATLQSFRASFFQGVSVSPDAHWVLYPQLDGFASNMVWTNNFL